ncbi:PhzF family phenazine biosynthesis protein [Streptomyces sp. NPDC059582]|uniref:PhzF family phenazine biosynthesis protein n=1 Tax=Streptomyces sp. NPDC059582 TaxID=3346875 RepID=UPI0036B4A320
MMTMPCTRSIMQVDAFSTLPYRGNPVAVVLDGGDLTEEEMQRLARWTILSETTFVLPPHHPGSGLPVADHLGQPPHLRVFAGVRLMRDRAS